MSKLNINKVRIIEIDKRFQGEAYYEGSLVAATIKFPNKANCIRALNQKINEYNALNYTKIPLMDSDGEDILYGYSQKVKAKITDNSSSLTESEALLDKAAEKKIQDNTSPSSRKLKPKRKPFTPYGLNGYLVDKQGNVRLMLDRRASASTIVLEPEMFAALAEMVQKTQSQQEKAEA